MGNKLQLAKLLARYLTEDQAGMSIRLSMGKPDAKLWAEFRDACPVRGYATEEEAMDILAKWLEVWK